MGLQTIALGLSANLPDFIKTSGPALQGIRPGLFRVVNGPAAIGAVDRRKGHGLDFVFSLLCRRNNISLQGFKFRFEKIGFEKQLSLFIPGNYSLERCLTDFVFVPRFRNIGIPAHLARINDPFNNWPGHQHMKKPLTIPIAITRTEADDKSTPENQVREQKNSTWRKRSLFSLSP